MYVDIICRGRLQQRSDTLAVGRRALHLPLSCQAFALQRVPDNRERCHWPSSSLANSMWESLWKLIQNLSQDRLRACRIDSKLVPGLSGGFLWRPIMSRDVSGCPGSIQTAPKTFWDSTKTDQILECSGTCRGDQSWHQIASGPGGGKTKFFARSKFAKHRHSDFSSILLDFWFFCNFCKRLTVLRLLAKTEVRPFTLQVKSHAQCNDRKTTKIDPNC